MRDFNVLLRAVYSLEAEKKMNQGKRTPQVGSSPPWWLLVPVCIIAVVVVGVVGLTSVPKSSDEVYAAAKRSLDADNEEEFNKNLAQLDRFSDCTAKVAYLKGLNAAKQSRDPRAARLFKEAAADPEIKASALQLLGESQMRMGELSSAIATYEEAVNDAVGDGVVTAKFNLASLYYSMGTYLSAEQYLDQILEVDPNHRDARTFRGGLRKERGRFREAIEDLQALLATAGDRAAADPKVLTNCGKALLRVGSDAEISEFLEVNFESISDIDVKGRLLARVGRSEELDPILKNGRAISKLSPHFPARLMALLQLHEKEDPEAAIAAIRYALEVNPRDRESYLVAIEVFSGVGNEESLAIAKQNLAAIEKLEQRCFDLITEVESDLNGFDARIAIANAMADAGRRMVGQQWLTMASRLNADRADEVLERQLEVHARRPFLFEFPALPTNDDVPADEKPADEKPAEGT